MTVHFGTPARVLDPTETEWWHYEEIIDFDYVTLQSIRVVQ